MANTSENRGHRPPRAKTAATKTLGSVRVTDEELALYGEAAVVAEQSRADWIRETLGKAARAVTRRRK